MADVVVSPTVLYTILFGSAGLLLFVTLSRLFGSANKENKDKDASSRERVTVNIANLVVHAIDSAKTTLCRSIIYAQTILA